MEFSLILDTLRFGVSGVLLALGFAIILGGAIALLRFPDFYTRLHAAGATDGLGAVLVILALAISAGDAAMAVRLVLLAALVAVLTPTLSHLAANAAHAAGLGPIAGAYTAPRPGARREPRS